LGSGLALQHFSTGMSLAFLFAFYLLITGWKHYKQHFITKSIEELEDQKKLGHIAKNDKCKYSRIASVNKIEDQNTLTWILKNNADWVIRRAAKNKLKDKNLLQKKAQNWKIFKEEMLKITETEFIKEAIKKIEDQKILLKIAKTCTGFMDSNLIEAVNKIKDQSFIADIAKNAESDFIRKAAVQKLENDKDLVWIAKNVRISEISSAAIKKLENQELLTDIAINAENVDSSRLALKKIQNPELIDYVLKSSKIKSVCNTAEKRLKKLKNKKE
jgi:hypothetical protein